MSSLVIRPGLPGDHDGWLDAALASWLDAYQVLLPAEEVANAPVMLETAWNKRSGELRLAILDGDVAGFYSLGNAAKPDEANYLWHLYVDPRFQRRGVGRALHDAALGEIASRGFTAAWLDVIRQNDKARAFYTALGWRVTGSDTADGYDLVVMERDI